MTNPLRLFSSLGALALMLATGAAAQDVPPPPTVPTQTAPAQGQTIQTERITAEAITPS